jgi:nucleoside-diphosphate-sugar epimerase
MLIRFLRGKLPFVVAGGMHFTDIRDVAQALVRIAEIPAPRPVYHLPGIMCTIHEFFAEAADVGRATTNVGGPSPRAPAILPYRLAWLLAMLNDRVGRVVRGKPFGLLPDPSLVEMASRYWSMESKYAEEELGYRPRSGRQTLADTIEWLYSAVPSPFLE